MATNLALDDKLIEEARRIGGHVTKKDAVTAALDEYIRRRKPDASAREPKALPNLRLTAATHRAPARRPGARIAAAL